MNMQERSDKRSLALHRAVVRKLCQYPDLWEKPLQNIERWTEPDGSLSMASLIWKNILETWEHEAIIKLLLSRSQRATFLRSSSPFTGIISQEERNRIFERYRKIYERCRENRLKERNLAMRKEYDFSEGKRASVIPHLAKLQAESTKS